MRNTKAGAHWDENWQLISDFPDLILEDNSMNLCKFSCPELIRYTRLHDKLDVTGLIFSFS